jgi:hypothetical protein
MGIPDAAPNGGDVIFKLIADGEEIYDSGSVTKGQIESVTIDVRGVNELILEVDTNGSQDCDHACWLDPRLYTATYSNVCELSWINEEHSWSPPMASSETYKGVVYSKSIYAHAHSKITYNLNKQYERFTSCIGLRDGAVKGDVIYYVFADGVKIYESGLLRNGDLSKVDISVRGANQLVLEVGINADQDSD